MNRRLEESRYDESGFRPLLAEKVDKEFIKSFNPETFALGNSVGVTIETMKLVQMMSAYKVGDEKVTKAVKTLVKLASSTSQDELSESQIFFLAPKGASSMDLNELNFYFAEILKSTQSHQKELSLYKNYFMGKAISENSVRVVYYALKGLNVTSD
jgi:hypothetical protein